MQVVDDEEEKESATSFISQSDHETASQASKDTQKYQLKQEEKEIMDAYLELEGDVFQDDN